MKQILLVTYIFSNISLGDHKFNIDYDTMGTKSRFTLIANRKYNVNLSECYIPNNKVYCAFLCIDRSTNIPIHLLYSMLVSSHKIKYNVNLTACNIPKHKIKYAYIGIDKSRHSSNHRLYITFCDDTIKEYEFLLDLNDKGNADRNTFRVEENSNHSIIGITYPSTPRRYILLKMW
ncbi:MAG: hypothetical protein QS748_10420 [Candidatus Endonucleobacter bathymodioli]|uniref:Uncharacterized protein n=1 Tax=Candidatus Endonucleibacter bathymodioli TaxID=539814 RepID=A0AA90NMK4_9GAMM|nr:hypothetical protein [Candidatus Endonucleobacter bathymodioli]